MSHCMLMMDENMSLREYCILHGYCYQTIRKYITELGLSYQEAIERFKRYRGRHDGKTIYWYNGESLMQYCLKHKYNYPTIRFKIVNEGYTVEEAVAYAEKLKQKKDLRKCMQ
ncbi:MAG: hypothetical protein IJ529_01930 [Alphaproteobacteria bacterium]|nr:hypothetical protein [Alphaproteobacteria bacterium]MBR1600030.1 hypothetical protein [Alphaproteobacteria bacterium]MBR1601777.1 hypothetical protein [Alphaproteobacteria bacterium]